MNIAVFYHCLLHSEHRHIDPDYAITLITSQMDALKRSGLSEAAAEITIGVNGSEEDAMAVSCMVPNKSWVVSHGKEATTEIPTMNIIHAWAKEHPGWAVLYHHSKGVSTPNQADGWRRRMENVNVWGWSECVKTLEQGHDACGCHWLTPDVYPGHIGSSFFGGTFWWAKSDYIATLPPLPDATWVNRYEAEVWIGRSPRQPRIRDFYPGWPTP